MSILRNSDIKHGELFLHVSCNPNTNFMQEFCLQWNAAVLVVMRVKEAVSFTVCVYKLDC